MVSDPVICITKGLKIDLTFVFSIKYETQIEIMKYRKLGDSGLEVSALGMGCMNLSLAPVMQ